MATKIAVCGDSFCSASNVNRDHFSQILEDDYGYHVANFARGGMSMIGVGFQIQHAIDTDYDLIIFARPYGHRMDIPNLGYKFDLSHGLKNFAYVNRQESTYGRPDVGDQHAAVITDVVPNLVPDADPIYRNNLITQDQRLAVKHFLLYLSIPELHDIVDEWLEDYWEMRIAASGKLCLPFRRNNWAKPAYDFAENTDGHPNLFHTDRATQETLAKYIDYFVRTTRQREAL